MSTQLNHITDSINVSIPMEDFYVFATQATNSTQMEEPVLTHIPYACHIFDLLDITMHAVLTLTAVTMSAPMLRDSSSAAAMMGMPCRVMEGHVQITMNVFW